jgi:hypothetical protein
LIAEGRPHPERRSGIARGAVEEIFRTAHELRLKGCTVFREASRRAILVDNGQHPAE